MNSIISFLSMLITSIYVSLGLAIANAPSTFSSTHIIHNVAYGPNPEQTMDIYVPASAKSKKLDVVVFFYGGRWTTGKKEDYRFVGQDFADEDFITIIPDYQKYPKVRFPVFIEDGAKALSWITDHISEYNGNTARINVTGHSAGAHIGALLATDERYLKHEGKTISKTIHRFAGLAGPYAFTPDTPELEDIFAPPENYPAMRASTFATGKEPPMLLMWGDKDVDVGNFNMERMVAAIHQKKGSVKSIIYPGIDHIGIIRPLTWMYRTQPPILQTIIDFLRE